LTFARAVDFINEYPSGSAEASSSDKAKSKNRDVELLCDFSFLNELREPADYANICNEGDRVEQS